MADQPSAVEIATLTERVSNLIARYERARLEDEKDRELDRAQFDRIEGQTRLTNGRVIVLETRMDGFAELPARVDALEARAAGEGGERSVRGRLTDRLVQLALTLLAAGAGALTVHFIG